MDETEGVVVSLDIATAELSPAAEEVSAKQKAKHAEAQRRYAKTRKEKRQVGSYVYDSQAEPTKPEGLKILEGRGIKNSHVCQVVYRLLLQAAEQHDVRANRFLFANGIVKTLASYEVKSAQLLEEISAEDLPGELSNRSELYALFDSSIAHHEPGLTFEEFLNIRLRCKQDCFYLGKEILEKDFAECHQVWTDFFPKCDPISLPPNYIQRQAINWLNEQSEIKNFLLLASRSSFKSSWSHIWLLSLILCQPDIRVLLVSETKPLSKDFIGVIRSYFETTPGQENRFQRIFPEYCIPEGDGSVLSLDVPMAHLHLAQSIESTSMDSAVAGRRADIILFDDPISSTSCGNDAQIQASIQKYLALIKLREVGGLVLVLGTPWAYNDLYAHLIASDDQSEEKLLAYRIDPAFTVKTEARKKLTAELLPTLLESEIDSFLFPERLNWKFLKSEISGSASFFLSQNLCIFPKDEEADLRVTFSLDDLRSHTRPLSFFNQCLPIETVMAIDTAFSTSRYADMSAISTIKFMKREARPIAVVSDCVLDRLKQSQLAVAIVEGIVRNQPTRILIEKNGPWEALSEAIRQAAMVRRVALPYIYWKSTGVGGTTLRNKASRIKGLEPLLVEGRLWFVSAGWNDLLFDQFCRFDGITKSNSHRKDDGPDSVGMAIEAYFTRRYDDENPRSAEQRREEEKAVEANRIRAWHDRLFGTTPQIQPADAPTEPQLDPRRAMLSRILPTGMRA